MYKLKSLSSSADWSAFNTHIPAGDHQDYFTLELPLSLKWSDNTSEESCSRTDARAGYPGTYRNNQHTFTNIYGCLVRNFLLYWKTDSQMTY